MRCVTRWGDTPSVKRDELACDESMVNELESGELVATKVATFGRVDMRRANEDGNLAKCQDS